MSNRRLIRKEGPLFITLKLEPKNSPSVTFLGRVGEQKTEQTNLFGLVVSRKLSSFGNCL